VPGHIERRTHDDHRHGTTPYSPRWRWPPGGADRSVLCGWNQRCQPFAWTKDTDQILANLNSGNTTATSDHQGDIPERRRRRSRPT